MNITFECLRCQGGFEMSAVEPVLMIDGSTWYLCDICVSGDDRLYNLVKATERLQEEDA